MHLSTPGKILSLLALLLFSGTGASQAAIVFIEPAGGIPIPANFPGVSIDLDTGIFTNSLAGVPDADVNFYFGGAEISNDADETSPAPTFQPVRTGTGNTDPAMRLVFGATVDGNSTYSSGFGSSGDIVSHFPQFTAGTPEYLGFSFIPNGGGSPIYGWMRVTLQNNDSPGLVHTWAFEDTGAAITVGQVPEPAAAMLILFGISTLLLRRRA